MILFVVLFWRGSIYYWVRIGPMRKNCLWAAFTKGGWLWYGFILACFEIGVCVWNCWPCSHIMTIILLQTRPCIWQDLRARALLKLSEVFNLLLIALLHLQLLKVLLASLCWKFFNLLSLSIDINLSWRRL
jgi:hypothetical protein